MKRNFLFLLFLLLLLCAAVPSEVSADSSHARIVRLSFIQGDVRFVREFYKDPVTDPKAIWEVAQLNLPIRQGNALSTGNGRAEVEFENGAMAFLGANTIIEFYDLSLHDGSRITRLILRQGSASFYDQSQNGDYFSVTGGDFSVEVTSHATFRLENFDNGSTVTVQNGRVTILQNDVPTPLEKGHSLTVNAQDSANPEISPAAPGDDFDRWVSGRIQTEQAVSSRVQPNTGSYVAGYADLYTYGSWMSVNGFNCWRPFGVGLGWSPFDYGNWMYDANIGWGFIGTSPWGWLPYHYGGWFFSPVYGWVWNPGSSFYGYGYGRPMPYRPVTAVFVHSGNTLAIVPMHPLDKPGKTPLNLSQGVYPVQNGTIAQSLAVSSGETWTVLKHSQVAGLSPALSPSAPPSRVSRTITTTSSPARESSFSGNSSIVYDANQHRFVNAGQGTVAAASGATPTNEIRTAITPIGVPPGSHTSTAASIPRATYLPSRPPVAPAAPHSSGGSSSGSSGGSMWGSASSSSVGSSRSSGTSSSHPSGGGGGRPH